MHAVASWPLRCEVQSAILAAALGVPARAVRPLLAPVPDYRREGAPPDVVRAVHIRPAQLRGPDSGDHSGEDGATGRAYVDALRGPEPGDL